MFDWDDMDPRSLILSAIGLLTKLAVYVVAAPLVVLGYWHHRATHLWDRRWCRHDVGTAGLHLLTCLVWTLVALLLWRTCQ